MIDLNERLYEGAAKTRKRCQHCRKMVEIGDRAVFRSFTKPRWGWQRGGFIGESGERRTHAYHEACASQAPELQGRN